MQSNTTPDPGHQTGKWQKHKKTQKTPFPAGNHKAARNRQDSMTDMKQSLKTLLKAVLC